MQTGELLLERVRKYNVWSAACPSRRVLDLIADKWTTLVLVELAPSPKYYTEIQHDVSGISHKMLSQTLRNLEKQNFVIRTVFPTVPPRVNYALTPLAQSLIPTLYDLINWAQDNVEAIQPPEPEPKLA